MAIKKITPKKDTERKISETHSVLNLITAEHSDKVSLAVSKSKNHKAKTKTNSDRIYYLLEGNLEINESITLKPGDAILITANTTYTLSGSFKAIIVNSPPFKKT